MITNLTWELHIEEAILFDLSPRVNVLKRIDFLFLPYLVNYFTIIDIRIGVGVIEWTICIVVLMVGLLHLKIVTKGVVG